MSHQPQTKPKGLSHNTRVKIAVLILIVLATASLLACHIFITKMKESNRDLQQQALELEQDNENLQQYLEDKDTDQGIKDVAEGELGMVDPDTIIYDFD